MTTSRPALERQTRDKPKASNKKEERRLKNLDNKKASPFEVFASLLADEQFRLLDTPEIRGIYTEWCSHRMEIDKPLTSGAVRLDAKHMLVILDAGGNVAEIVQRIQKAIGAGWRGWFFAESAQPGQPGVVPTKRMQPSADPMQSIHQSFTGVS